MGVLRRVWCIIKTFLFGLQKSRKKLLNVSGYAKNKRGKSSFTNDLSDPSKFMYFSFFILDVLKYIFLFDCKQILLIERHVVLLVAGQEILFFSIKPLGLIQKIPTLSVVLLLKLAFLGLCDMLQGNYKISLEICDYNLVYRVVCSGMREHNLIGSTRKRHDSVACGTLKMLLII